MTIEALAKSFVFIEVVELVEGCGVCVDNDAVVFQDSTLSDAFQKK